MRQRDLAGSLGIRDRVTKTNDDTAGRGLSSRHRSGPLSKMRGFVVKHFFMISAKRGLAAAFASLLLGVAVAPNAFAGTLRYWNSQSNPLTVVNEGGHAAGQAYGNWNIATGGTGTESQARGYLKDLLPSNGYNVYFKLETWTNAGYCIQPDYTSCNQKYFYYDQEFSGGTKETWNQNYWSPQYLAATKLDPGGDYARAEMYVSESNNFGDPYAGPTYTKGNPY